MTTLAAPLHHYQTRGAQMRAALAIGPRVVVAAVLLAVCQTGLSGILLGGTAAATSGSDQPRALVGLTGVGLLYAAALSYPVVRSRWRGWSLAGAILLVYAGINPVLIHAETVLFLVILVPIIPPGVVPGLVTSGLLTAAVYAPLLVLVWGKWRGPAEAVSAGQGWAFSTRGWIARFALIGCVYTAIYFAFGMLVAVPLAGPAFAEYYRGLVLPPWMPLFQVARGMAWAAIMLPILRMMRGAWWEGAVAPDGPLVLVGHSQGGLYTNALARIAGARVSGVALLDPAHPDNGRLRRELPTRLFQRSRSDLAVGLRLGRRLARLHVLGAVKPLMMKGPPFIYCSQHPPEALDTMWRHLKRPLAYETALAEYEELEFRTTPADMEALGVFPPVPLVVLVHDPAVMIDSFVKRAGLQRPEAERVEGMWGTLLADHASLSPLAKLESVAGSGHLIHLEKPNVTVAWIAELVQAAAACRGEERLTRRELGMEGHKATTPSGAPPPSRG